MSAHSAFDDLAADARAGIDLLATHSQIADRSLAVVGHDEGALLAMRVAAPHQGESALVLISSSSPSIPQRWLAT